MAEHSSPPLRGFLRHLRDRLTAGLLLLVPLLITYWILGFAFRGVDGLLQPLVQEFLDRRIPGLGLVILVVAVYFAGLLASNFVGRSLIHLGQQALLRVPLISTVYDASKQLIESFAGTAKTGFKRVVAIEYPRQGAWALGFLTGTTTDEADNPLGIVYIPTAPTPNSGWVAILPMSQIHDTDLTVQVAMRMILSGGIMAPPRIRKSPAS